MKKEKKKEEEEEKQDEKDAEEESRWGRHDPLVDTSIQLLRSDWLKAASTHLLFSAAISPRSSTIPSSYLLAEGRASPLTFFFFSLPSRTRYHN